MGKPRKDIVFIPNHKPKVNNYVCIDYEQELKVHKEREKQVLRNKVK